jgi:hypothetical protein
MRRCDPAWMASSREKTPATSVSPSTTLRASAWVPSRRRCESTSPACPSPWSRPWWRPRSRNRAPSLVTATRPTAAPRPRTRARVRDRAPRRGAVALADTLRRPAGPPAANPATGAVGVRHPIPALRQGAAAPSGIGADRNRPLGLHLHARGGDGPHPIRHTLALHLPGGRVHLQGGGIRGTTTRNLLPGGIRIRGLAGAVILHRPRLRPLAAAPTGTGTRAPRGRGAHIAATRRMEGGGTAAIRHHAPPRQAARVRVRERGIVAVHRRRLPRGGRGTRARRAQAEELEREGKGRAIICDKYQLGPWRIKEK